MRGACNRARLPARLVLGHQRHFAHRQSFETCADLGLHNRHRRRARRRESDRHAWRRRRRQHGDRSRHIARSLGGDNARGELGLDPRSLGSPSLDFQRLGKAAYRRVGGWSRAPFCVAAGQSKRPSVVAGARDDHRSMLPVFAQRLARIRAPSDIADANGNFLRQRKMAGGFRRQRDAERTLRFRC